MIYVRISCSAGLAGIFLATFLGKGAEFFPPTSLYNGNSKYYQIIDGDTNTESSMASGTTWGPNPWVRVDLGVIYNISQLEITSYDSSTWQYSDLDIFLGLGTTWRDSQNAQCGNRTSLDREESRSFNCSGIARYIFVRKFTPPGQHSRLRLAEIRVWGEFVANMRPEDPIWPRPRDAVAPVVSVVPPPTLGDPSILRDLHEQEVFAHPHSAGSIYGRDMREWNYYEDLAVWPLNDDRTVFQDFARQGYVVYDFEQEVNLSLVAVQNTIGDKFRGTQDFLIEVGEPGHFEEIPIQGVQTSQPHLNGKTLELWG